MLIQILKEAVSFLRRKIQKHLAERDFKNRKATAMSKFGWDCHCPGCKLLMHTNDLVESFRETEFHWHYTCKCGTVSAWHLYTPVPMFDPSYVDRRVKIPDTY